jgi:hypothetical protein
MAQRVPYNNDILVLVECFKMGQTQVSLSSGQLF